MASPQASIRLLLDFDQAVSQTESLSVITQALLFYEKHFQCDRISISLYEQEQKGLVVYTKDSSTPGLGAGQLLPASKTEIHALLANTSPLYCADMTAIKTPNKVEYLLVNAGFKTGFIIPLVVGEDVVGSLNFDSRKRNSIPEENRAVMVMLSSRLSLALYHAGLHDALVKKEQAIKISEKDYRDLVDQAGDVILKGRSDGFLVQVNPAAVNLFGYTDTELLQMNIADLFSAEILHEKPFRYDLLEQGQTVITERTALHKEGHTFPVEMNSRRLANGFLVSIIRDLTERQEAQEKLKDREQRLLDAQEMARLGSWEYAFAADSFSSSERFSELLQLKPGFLNGSLKKLMGLIHVEDRAAFELGLSEAARQESALNITLRLQVQARELWFTFRARLKSRSDTSHTFLIGTAQDVTDLHTTQKALRTSEASAQQQFQLLRSISDNTPNLVWATDLEKRLTFVNKEFCRYILDVSNTSDPLGKTLEEALSKRVDLLNSESLHSALVEFKSRGDLAEDLYQGEISGNLNGEAVFLNVSRIGLKDHHGKPTGSVYSAYNISLQKTQTVELENSKNQIQAFLDAVPAPLYAKDKQGRYVHLNEKYLTFFGKTAEGMIGKTTSECWDEETAFQFEEDDCLLIENNKRQMYAATLHNGVGEPRDVMVHKARYFDAKGDVAGLIGTLWDYSDLKAAEDRYHNLFDISPIPVVVHNSTHILAANQAAIDFYGGNDPDLYFQQPVLEFVHPDSRQISTARSTDILKHRRAQDSMEQKYLTASGEVRDVEVVAAPVEFENQRAVLISFRDITEEKQHRDLLRASEKNYRNLMDMTPNPIIVHRDGELLYANRSALTFSGVEGVADLQGVDLYSFVHPDGRERSRETLEQVLQSGQSSPPGEQKYIRGDGEVRDVESRAVPITYEGRGAVLVSFVDNTDRMQASKALQESRKQLEMVTDHVTHFILLVDYDFTILYANQSCANFLRLNKDSLPGMSAFDVITYPALEKTKSLLQNVENSEPQGFSYTYTHMDGRIAEYWTTLIPVKSSDGSPLAFLAQVEDITEREQARRELADNRELLELIIDTIPALVSYADDAERYLFVNKAYAQWYGMSKYDIIGMSLQELMGEQSYRDIKPMVQNVLSGDDLYFSQFALDQHNMPHILDVRYLPHFDQQQQVKAFLAVRQDVTEQRQAEVYQEALRELASSLTKPLSLHDIGEESAKTIRSVFKSDAIAIEIFDHKKRINHGIYSEDTFVGTSEPVEVSVTNLPFDKLLPIHYDTKYEPTCTNRSEEDLKQVTDTIAFGEARLSKSLLNVPIRWEGDALGIISVQSYTENRYSQKDLPLLQTFGDQIGVAILRALQDAEIFAQQAAVEKEEQKYRSIIENAGDAVFVCSQEGQILIVNDRSSEALGYSSDELVRFNLKQIDPVFFENSSPKVLKGLGNKGETLMVLSSYLRKDGSSFPVELRISMTEIDEQPSILVFARDITERKQAESRELALRQLAHRLNESNDMLTVGRMAAQSIRDFFDSDAFAIEFYDHDKQMIIGVYSEDTLKEGSPPQEVRPRDTPFSEVREDFFNLNSETHVRNRTPEELKRHKGYRPFGSGRFSRSLLFAPIVWDDRNIGVLTVQSYTSNKYSDADLGNVQLFADQIGGALMRAKVDASLLTQTNALLKSELDLTGLLKEKDILLKEVYHRTKNNMQVIVGLLDMQSYKTSNTEVRDVLREMNDRISSMSLVHDLLYRSKNLADIKLDGYLDKLVTRLVTAYQSPSTDIDVHISAEPIRINIQLAVPLGLVINEVVTNALKYAFSDKRSGELRLTATRWEEHGLILNIGDNGVGMRDGFDPATSDSLGIKIIRDIVELQLLGSITLDRSDGVSYQISIPDITLEGKGL